MKKQFLLMSLLVVLLFSCNEDDQFPPILLEGTYEANLQGESGNSLNTMTFGTDGSLYVERFSSFGDSQELCLLNYQIGTYSLEDSEFIFTINESYGPDPLAQYGGCPGKQNLVPQLGSEPLVVKGILVFSNTRNEFNLEYQCPEPLPYMCLGSKDFKLTNP